MTNRTYDQQFETRFAKAEARITRRRNRPLTLEERAELAETIELEMARPMQAFR